MFSAVFVRDTSRHVDHEARHTIEAPDGTARSTFGQVFARTSWSDRRLFATCQAGLVNNLNDGMAWGLLPLFFAAEGMSLHQIAVLAAVYPGVWGVAQLGTGALSDQIGRKGLIVGGMWTQAVGIGSMLVAQGYAAWILGSSLLGLGTAMVYPTLLAAIVDVAHPQWRASAVGVYRLWRDSGYAIGALLAGVIADFVGLRWAMGTVGLLTFASGIVVLGAMAETLATARAVPRLSLRQGRVVKGGN
jgi:MFS family permease